MSNYNLVAYSSIVANTSSGTGNTTITSSEASLLYDNITSSGIPLVSSGTLYLDIDIGNRVKLSNVYLHLTSPETPANIITNNLKLYYKDNLSDEYISGNLTYTDKYNLIDYIVPLTSRYFRVTISGISGSLDELVIHNDDTDVAFGSSGTTETLYVNDISTYVTLPIFNNATAGTTPVNAFTSVDYSVINDYNDYIKLSGSANGTYKSVLDGVAIKDDLPTNFGWRGGSHSNTEVDVDTGYVTSANDTRIALDDELIYLPEVQSTLTNDDWTFVRLAGTAWRSAYSHLKLPAFSGKWYWEYTITASGGTASYIMLGPTLSRQLTLDNYFPAYDSGWAIYGRGPDYTTQYAHVTIADSADDYIQQGDNVGVAVDLNLGYIWFSINGVWQHSGVPASGTGPKFTNIIASMTKHSDYSISPAIASYAVGNETTLHLTPSTFTYTTPSGFQAASDILLEDQKYTSPILSLSDSNLANQVYFDYTTTTGTYLSLNTDAVNGGQIEARSSNTAPEIYQDLYVAASTIPYYVDLNKYKINTFDKVEYVTRIISSNYNYWATATLCNNKYGYIMVFVTTTYNYGLVYCYDVLNDSQSTYINTPSANTNIRFDYDVQCTGEGTIWGYDSFRAILSHYSADMTTELFSSDSATHYISGLAADLLGEGLWYVNSILKELVHIDSLGSTITNIALSDPKDVASTSTGGCWSNDGADVTNYDYDGATIKTITLPANVHIMCHDLEDGFWCICTDGYLYQVSNAGNILLTIEVGYDSTDYTLANTNHATEFFNVRSMILRPTKDKVYIYKNYLKTIEIFSKGNSSITATYDIPVSSDPYVQSSIPDVFYIDSNNSGDVSHFTHFDGILPPTHNLFPVQTDPVWGPNGALDWRVINRDSNFLSKEFYHQFRVPFLNDPLSEGKSYLKGIYIPPAIELQDIAPQSSKNIYMKTNFPANTSMFEYNIKLKTWWGLQ